MAKAALQDRQIEMGGQALTIRFGIRATLFLQDHWKLENEQEVRARMAEKNPGLNRFVDIFWAALQAKHSADYPGTPEGRMKVVELLDEAGLDGLTEGLQQVLDAGSPPEDDRPVEGQEKPPSS